MITTVYDPQQYLVTTKKIMAEFITTYIPEAKVVPAFPDIPDDASLPSPLIEINQMLPNGLTIKRNGNRVEVKRLFFNVLVFTDGSTGKQMKRDEISQKLEYAFFKHADELGKAGLKRVAIDPPEEIPLDTTLVRYCNSHVVGMDVLLA